MRRKQWLRVLAVGTAAFALAATACSDDSGGGSSGSTDDPGADLTGEPVKIMVLGSFEAFGSDYTQVPDAAQAAASSIEEDGGLNGSPIEIIVCNTASENDATDCGRQAVEEEVVATVGTFATYAPQYLPILEEAGIPQVAPYPIDFSDYSSPINYPLFAGVLSITGGMGAELADEGAATINVSYLDIGAGAAAAGLVEAGALPRGAEVVSETPVPDATVDFSPQVADATGDDPEGIAVLLTTSETPGFLRALSQSGYEGLVSTATSSITPAQLQELSDVVEGLLVPNGFVPATLEGNAAVDQFNDEMDEYARDAPRDDSAQNAWLGMHLIADVMDGQGKVTSTKIIDALENAGEIDLGMIPPINFAEPIPNDFNLERVFNTSVVYTVVEDGQLVATTGEFVDVLED